jgi:Right handed beta helix region
MLATLNSGSRTFASGQPITRVYVAASGSDSNACTFKSPCRGVNRARATFDRTTHSGTITIIESGNYPAFEIQDLGRDTHGNEIHRAVTVEAAPGVMATISGGVQDAGIFIHVGSQDLVVLRNLHIDEGSGNNGIDVKTGRWTYVESCSISNVNFGIDMRDSSELFVTDSVFKRTSIGVLAAGYFDFTRGVWMNGPSVSIDNCRFELESTAAVKVADGAQAVIRNSVIAGTHDNGVWCTSDRPGVRTLLFVENSSITGSGFKCVGLCTGSAGIKAGAGKSPVEVTLSNNVITQNKVGVIVGENGKVFSYGNNHINGNGNGRGDGSDPNDVQGAFSLINAH